MSKTFTKLFSSITESTIWTEPDHIRITWIAMLAMADRRGRVWASIPGLANRARVSVPQAEEAINRFLQPDKYSRTPDHDGRRIEPIDGGWKLLNYEKYRTISDDEAVLESKRQYINTRREAEKAAGEIVGQPPAKFSKPTLDECKLYGAKIALADVECVKFWNFYESKGWKVGKNPMVSWPHAMTGWKSRVSQFSTGSQPQQLEREETIEQRRARILKEATS